MGVSDDAAGFPEGADEFAPERESGPRRPRDVTDWGDATGEPFDDDSLDDDSLDSDALDHKREDLDETGEQGTYFDELYGEAEPVGDPYVEDYQGYGDGLDELSAAPGEDEAFEPSGQGEDEILHEVDVAEEERDQGR
jgi:hypothetical protein